MDQFAQHLETILPHETRERCEVSRVLPSPGVMYVIQITRVMPRDELGEFVESINRLLTRCDIEDVPVLILNGDRKLNIMDDDALASVGLRRILSG